jgi:hypothetical protein
MILEQKSKVENQNMQFNNQKKKIQLNSKRMAISMIIQARLNGKSSRSNVHPSIGRKQIQHTKESERPNNGHLSVIV